MIKETQKLTNKFIDSLLQQMAAKVDNKIGVSINTVDEIFSTINLFVDEFYTAIRTPLLSKISVKHLEPLSPNKQAAIVTSAISDVSSAYNKVADAQNQVLTRLNRYFSTFRNVEDRINHANSAILTAKRTVETDVIEISDTFKDESKVDPGTQNKMTVNQIAGLVTLPVIESNNIDIANIQILDSSNGFECPDHPLVDSFDKNLDTRFDYVRKTLTDDLESLNLYLLISLKNTQLINGITITPYNFDEKSFPVIKVVETSVDGRIFNPIRNSLPSNLTRDEEDEIFVLGPVGYKNQSQASFVFTPVTARFIKILISQGKKTKLEQNLFTQKIGIRDITISKTRYSDVGEITSSRYELPYSPGRLYVTDRAALTEPLISINYQLSLDGGSTFLDIEKDTEIEVNTGSKVSLNVESQTNNIQLKIIAKRDEASFNGIAAPLANEIKTVQKKITIDQTPNSFGLENIPIQDTLQVFQQIASIGTTDGTILEEAQGQDSLTIDIPLSIPIFSESIKVNGQPWTRVSTFDLTGPSDRHYKIDYLNKEIQFGDGVQGMLPFGPVKMELDPERILIPDTSPYIVELDYNHDYNKEHIKATWYDRPRIQNQEVLTKGADDFQLENTNVLPSLDVTEDIPAGLNTFYLKNIPATNGLIEFSDKKKFKLQVSEEPEADGEYKVSQLISGTLSPVLITVFTKTDTQYPGVVSFEAIGKVSNPADTYNPELWTSGNVQMYSPVFSDTAIFNIEKLFIDGESELEKAGDFSIDYKSGKIYSFSRIDEQISTYVSYYHQKQRDLPWEFTAKSNEIVISDDTVLVNKNDSTYVELIVDDLLYFVVYKDKRFINIPFNSAYIQGENKAFSTTNNGVTISFIPKDDFIRGTVLPKNRSRIRLAHQSIVKNSVRFVFLSDDVNAVDDRIVTRDNNNEIVVSPKPVKDIYGNSLTGSTIGITTQRDVDKTVLANEVPFINGREELLREGDYSVDYESGILYSYIPVPEHTIIQYEYADIRVSYIATKLLTDGKEYDLDLRVPEIAINSIDNKISNPGLEVIIRYNIISSFTEDPTKIIEYYSPILFGYSIRVSK